MKEKAFINGKIYTVNDKQPFEEALLIEGNKIVLAGSNDEVKSRINESAEIIDLKGKLMLPGFIDAHLHLMNGGYYLSGINLRSAKSISEFIRILKDYSKNIEGKWITGGSWDHEQWEEKSLPNKEMIDPFTSHTPVFVERVDKHVGLANSFALKLARINNNTPDPSGGKIIKDERSGEPTGILKDNAMNLIYSIIPENSNEENYYSAMLALNEAKKCGITSVHDISYKNDLFTYLQLEKDNKLTCRIYSILPINNYESLDKDIEEKINNSKKIKFRGLKAFSDGSLGAGTAWFFEPYIDNPSSGLPQDIIINGKLKEWAAGADKNKLQIATHAIGDKANAYVLDIYEKVKNENPYWDRRSRIEHAQHLRFEDIPRFTEVGVIASCQPYHLFFDGSWAEKKIGPERVKFSYPFNTLLNNGAELCFGSDWPVVPLNPLNGIYTAVTRQTSDNSNPDGWIPREKISVKEAIKCYTLKSAYASFEEKIKGSIEPGKLADLVVLSDDIFQISPEKIKDVRVDMTIFDGEIIYTRNKD